MLEREIVGILDTALIIEATGGRIIGGEPASFSGVCIDSRKIKEGELFIAQTIVSFPTATAIWRQSLMRCTES